MGQNSNIEWTDATWNPVVGCSMVSPGCAHCYAERGNWAPKGNFSGIAEWDRANVFALVGADGHATVVHGNDEPDEEFGLRCCDLDGNDGAAAMAMVGKKAAGRFLDGRTHDELPASVKA